MADGSNPLAAIAAMLGGQGSQPAPDQSQGDQMGQQVSAQLSQLQGADPQMVLRQLQQMKSVVASLIPHTAQRIPGVARHLAQCLRGFDGAIKEASQAQATEAAVAPASPIGMSAVSNSSY